MYGSQSDPPFREAARRRRSAGRPEALESRGAGVSQAALDAEVRAEIVFHAGVLEQGASERARLTPGAARQGGELLRTCGSGRHLARSAGALVRIIDIVQRFAADPANAMT